jgi:site-specific DNA-cytosine methylase
LFCKKLILFLKELADLLTLAQSQMASLLSEGMDYTAANEMVAQRLSASCGDILVEMKALLPPTTKADCELCGKKCALFPHLHPETKAAHEGRVTIKSIGLLCQPFSNMGSKQGILDPRYMVTLQLALELLVGEYDALIIENNQLFRASLVLEPLIGSKYTIAELPCSSSDFGAQAERNRKYHICLNRKGKLVLPDEVNFDKDGLKTIFGCPPVLDPEEYFKVEPQNEIDAMVEGLRKATHLPKNGPDGKPWTYEHVMSRANYRRMSDIRSARQLMGTKMYANIDQTNDYANASMRIPALLRRTYLFSFNLRRCLTAPGHLQVMGLSLFDKGRHPSPLRGFLLGSSRPKDTVMKSLAGNAYSKSQAMAVLLYLLGLTKLRDQEQEESA